MNNRATYGISLPFCIMLLLAIACGTPSQAGLKPTISVQQTQVLQPIASTATPARKPEMKQSPTSPRPTRIGSYSWRAFPATVFENPGTGDGWKYLVVDFAIQSIGQQPSAWTRYGLSSNFFFGLLRSLTLKNDMGFVYSVKEEVPIQAYYDSNRDAQGYFQQHSYYWWFFQWVVEGFTVQRMVVWGRLAAPIHAVFKVPETSKSYQLTIPDGTAFEPAVFSVKPGGPVAPPSYPFIDPSKFQQAHTQPITTKTGTLRLGNSTVTEDPTPNRGKEIMLNYTFQNASAGYGAKGGADNFLVDNQGIIYTPIDSSILWEAGPGKTISGSVKYGCNPTQCKYKYMWLVLNPYSASSDGSENYEGVQIFTFSISP